MVVTHTRVRKGDESHDCGRVTETLELIGDKWTVLVVAALSLGTLRYGELQRAVEGISQRMLTLTLKQLEADGLVRRTVHPTIPPRVDYELTDLGLTLIEPLRALHDWTMAHRGEILEARAAHQLGTREDREPDAEPSVP